jgi:hypothetical protein
MRSQKSQNDHHKITNHKIFVMTILWFLWSPSDAHYYYSAKNEITTAAARQQQQNGGGTSITRWQRAAAQRLTADRNARTDLTAEFRRAAAEIPTKRWQSTKQNKEATWSLSRQQQQRSEQRSDSTQHQHRGNSTDNCSSVASAASTPSNSGFCFCYIQQQQVQPEVEDTEHVTILNSNRGTTTDNHTIVDVTINGQRLLKIN